MELLLAVASCYCMSIAASLTVPVIVDYVDPEDYGKGGAIAFFGFNSGILFSMLFAFNYTKNMDPKWAYGISSCMIALIAVLTPFLVKEPVDVSEEKVSCKKFCKLLKKSFYIIFTRAEVLFGYLSTMLVQNDILVQAVYI